MNIDIPFIGKLSKVLSFTCLLIFISSISNHLYAQAATATWPSTANGNVTVTGNITATNHAFSAGLLNQAYNTTYGANATNFGGTTACVPTYNTYFQYTVSPSGCNNLTVTSISFIHQSNSTGNRCWQLYYSIDGGTDTKIGNNIAISNTPTTYNSGTLSISIPRGSTIRFRLYGSGSTTTIFGSRNFIVNGTTSASSVTPSVSISANPGSTICTSTSVTFTATPTNGGTTPSYQWKLNGANVGTNSPNYTNAGLVNGNNISCVMTSNMTCASPATATSNTITMTVLTTPATPGSITGPPVVSPNKSGLIYFVTAVPGASSYTWTVPPGWTITGGQGTTSITVTSGAIGNNGNITVTASNMCGTSAASSKAVTVSQPHDGCYQCHISHTSPGITLTSVSGNALLCMSCHNPTGLASGSPFADIDKAIPGIGGNSHAWDVQAVNAWFETNITTNSEMALRLPGNNIICSTCHNQHSITYTPFLRASNSGDALCKDCHSSRNVGRYFDNPTLNKGSHPVGLLYNGSDPRLLSTPTYPIQTVGSNIECSSCHKTHFAASNDGNLLRVLNNDNLCTDCHTYKTHKGMGCSDCHQTHNINKTNIFLVKDNINTPNSGSKPVLFTSLTGTNSFADGDATYNGICEVCHTTPIHHRNTNDGGVHQDATNCTSCHPHNMRFYPQTNCLNCHNTVQDNGDGIPVGGRRQITGVGGDFIRNSHHVTGSVTEADCVKCHFMGNHMNGYVELMDPDAGDLLVYTYDPLNKSAIEDFCKNCHDSNGAAGDMTPFTDNVTVPVIDESMWTGSSHKSSLYTCLNCHDNGHGSNKDKLLGPYNKTADASADPMDDEEEFCFNCHKTGGSATSDIQTEFGRTHTHQVNEVAQFGTNSGLECINCHNPHYNSSTYKTSNPDNTDLLWTQTTNGDRDFCLKCHDGAPPAGITFPATSYGTGWNKSGYVNSRHDATINIGEQNYVGTVEDCRICHEHHGANGTPNTNKTGIYTMLKGTYDKSGNATSNACNPWLSTDYGLCFQCHNTTDITSGGAFGDHNLHVSGQQSMCILCHDVHKSYDASEKGLINFSYAVSTLAGTDITLGTYNLSTSFVETTGRCYLTCHASTWGCGSTGHSPKTYSGTDLTYPWTYAWPK